MVEVVPASFIRLKENKRKLGLVSIISPPGNLYFHNKEFRVYQ
jgi:hypothetical protein